MAKAEEEFGVQIFDRRSKPVVATEPGRALIALAQEVLMAHERLLVAASGTAQVTGRFTLGVIPTLAPYVLPWFLGPFSEQYPRVELTILERPTDTIMAELQAMRMDAGLVATPLGEPWLEGRVLFYDPFYVYAHPASPLLALDEVGLADIDRADLWLLDDGHCFRTQVVHLCGRHERQVLRSVQFEAGSFETLRALIEQLGGFTLVPETYARTLSPELRCTRVRPFQDPLPTREVSLVAHRGHWKTDILDAVSATLRSCAPRSLPREAGKQEVLPVRR